MSHLRSVFVPRLIRLKADALDRISVYLGREGWEKPLLLISEGLPEDIVRRITESCQIAQRSEVSEASVEAEESIRSGLGPAIDAVIGLGGGRTLDLAKSLAFHLNLPYLALPTSLSNDGFCSPNASLTKNGRRFTSPARLPAGVVVDLKVVQNAPRKLWLSGVGDLVAKRTAIFDWKRAFHTDGTAFDDLAALLSDASVYQFMAYPMHDDQGIKLLAQALLFNGVAMEMAGCSRPASGSEHLISHALDRYASKPHLHGLQVGLATYWMAKVQGQDVSDLDKLFETTGFWDHWRENPMPKSDWVRALNEADRIKSDFITVLSRPESQMRALELLDSDARIRECLSL